MLLTMKPIATLIVLFAFLMNANAQTNQHRKSLFFELAGSGGVGSINYESSFFQHKNTEYAWHVGLSFAPIDKNNGTGIVVPLMVSSITGKKAHKLEFGLGQGITVTTKGSFFLLTTLAAGYRYQHPDKRFFYRVTYTPLVSYLVDFQIQQWAGLSIGYTFKSK